MQFLFLVGFLPPKAIDFAKEQNDDDLWEELLKYSENKPCMFTQLLQSTHLKYPWCLFSFLKTAFIRVLLENVGVEINPLRIIQRIPDGLEIPGLRAAVIKILQDFQLQISLLEGCQAILNGDILQKMEALQSTRTRGIPSGREWLQFCM